MNSVGIYVIAYNKREVYIYTYIYIYIIYMYIYIKYIYSIYIKRMVIYRLIDDN